MKNGYSYSGAVVLAVCGLAVYSLHKDKKAERPAADAAATALRAMADAILSNRHDRQ